VCSDRNKNRRRTKQDTLGFVGNHLVEKGTNEKYIIAPKTSFYYFLIDLKKNLSGLRKMLQGCFLQLMTMVAAVKELKLQFKR